MRQATVIGHLVAEAKHASPASRKILVLSDGDGDDAPLQLAIDAVGAGIGTHVLVSESGAAGAEATGIEYPPIRSVVVGIIDSNSGIIDSNSIIDKDSVS